MKTAPVYSVFFILTFNVCFSQICLIDKSSGKEILIVPSSFPAPTQYKKLGPVKTSGNTGFDDNAQLEKLTRKVIKKGANLVRVTDFFFDPGSLGIEGLIEGDMYIVSNFDSLKATLIKRTVTIKSGYSEVIFYRPHFDVKEVEKYPLKMKIDTVNLAIGTNKAYRFELKNDSTYFIKIPDYTMVKLMVNPKATNYVRCCYKENTEGKMIVASFGLIGAYIYVNSGGTTRRYVPEVLVGRSNEMKELEYLMSGFVK